MANVIMKVTIVVIGIFCILISMMFENMGKIFSASYTITCIVYTPVGVLFLLGMLFPWTSAKGAMFGAFGCALFTAFVSVGANLSKVNHGSSGIYPEDSINCANNLTMMHMHTNLNSTLPVEEEIFPLFKLSFMLYNCFGISVGIAVGLITSFLTGPQDLTELDHKLICPPLRRFLPKKNPRSAAEEMKFITEMISMEKHTNGINGGGINDGGVNGGGIKEGEK